ITKDVLTDEGIIEIVNYEFDKEENEAKNNDDKDPPSFLITITKAIKALKKVISYQESLEVRKGFKKNELIALQKKLKE
ncbi:5299_t:CDS:1, partial [Racocetra persica]